MSPAKNPLLSRMHSLVQGTVEGTDSKKRKKMDSNNNNSKKTKKSNGTELQPPQSSNIVKSAFEGEQQEQKFECEECYSIFGEDQNVCVVGKPDADAQTVADKSKTKRTKSSDDTDITLPNLSKDDAVPAKKSKKAFSCVECGAVLKSIEIFESHLKSSHVVGGEFPCKLCPCVFKTFRSLSTHHGYYHKVDAKRRKIQVPLEVADKTIIKEEVNTETAVVLYTGSNDIKKEVSGQCLTVADTPTSYDKDGKDKDDAVEEH